VTMLKPPPFPMKFEQVNVQRSPVDFIVVALTAASGAFVFRTLDAFAAANKYTEIASAGGFVFLALYAKDGKLLKSQGED
jgi:hypothetical protein